MLEGALDFDLTPSRAETVDVPCPACRKPFDFEAWSIVNARRDQMLAHAVRDGSIFTYTCPRCGYTADLIRQCLYLDPESRSCVHLVVSPEMAALAEVTFDGYEMDDGRSGIDGSRRRIVFNRFDLREKARMFGDGCDDRAMELVKLDVLRSRRRGAIARGIQRPDIRFGFRRGSLITLDVFSGGERSDIMVPVELYRRYSEAIASSSLAEHGTYYVDSAWAQQAIDVLRAERVL